MLSVLLHIKTPAMNFPIDDPNHSQHKYKIVYIVFLKRMPRIMHWSYLADSPENTLLNSNILINLSSWAIKGPSEQPKHILEAAMRSPRHRPAATCNKNCLVGSSPTILCLAGFLALSFPPEAPGSEDPLTGVLHSSAVTTAPCLLWLAARAPGDTSVTRSPLIIYKKDVYDCNRTLTVAIPAIREKYFCSPEHHLLSDDGPQHAVHQQYQHLQGPQPPTKNKRSLVILFKNKTSLYSRDFILFNKKASLYPDKDTSTTVKDQYQ